MVQAMSKEEGKKIRQIESFIGSYQSLNEILGNVYYRRLYYRRFPYWRLDDE